MVEAKANYGNAGSCKDSGIKGIAMGTGYGSWPSKKQVHSCEQAQHQRPMTGHKARVGSVKTCGVPSSRHAFLQGLLMSMLMQCKPVRKLDCGVQVSSWWG